MTRESPRECELVLVRLLLRPARSRRARRSLALLPALPARRPAALHAGGDRTLHRRVVTARRSDRDDQLLLERGAAVAQACRSAESPDLGAQAGYLGARRS